MLPLGAGDLVDLVDIDDAVLGPFYVAVGLAHQFAHQILHVAADIARLAELGGVRLDERHPEPVGDQLDDKCLADAGRTDHEDIVLDIAYHAVAVFGRQGKAVEVGADFGGQDGLGPVLFDDVAVEVGYELFGLDVEAGERVAFLRGLVAFLRGLRGVALLFSFFLLLVLLGQKLAQLLGV